MRRTRVSLHRSVAAMAEVGNDIIVAPVLSDPWRLLSCQSVLHPEYMLFVGGRNGAGGALDNGRGADLPDGGLQTAHPAQEGSGVLGRPPGVPPAAVGGV
ncbi:hypothetical protein [Streptomyces sp. NPDC058678]|uniref:phosphotransferase-like protein n=1 Tax=Streptomyces sp. NPDC058678 TaxID=3346595 RepID=UPI003648E468